jgi:hypothetical protein
MAEEKRKSIVGAEIFYLGRKYHRERNSLVSLESWHCLMKGGVHSIQAQHS